MGVTFKATETLCDTAPESPVPVIVNVEFSGCAELSALIVKVLAPEVLDGLNDAVTPAGSPDAVRLAPPSSPFLGITTIFVIVLLPWVTERLVAELESRKSFSPAAAGGRTSYSGCAGFTRGFSSTTDIARIRIFGLLGSFIIFVPGSRSIAYANR